MALHRAEQIVAAAVTALTGLTTTASRVYRGRIWPMQYSDLPGLLVYMGADDPVPEPASNVTYQDCVLELNVEAIVRSSSAQIDTSLNLIAKEVITALMTSPQLGLSWVIDTVWAGTGRPEMSGADQPIGSALIRFQTKYRRSYADPSA